MTITGAYFCGACDRWTVIPCEKGEKAGHFTTAERVDVALLNTLQQLLEEVAAWRESQR